MSIYSLPPLISVFATSVLFLLLRKHAQDENLRKTGFALCSAAIGWQLCVCLLFSCNDPYMAEKIVRVEYTAIVFVPVIFGQFIYFAVTGKVSRFLYYTLLLSGGLVPFIWFSDLLVSGVEKYFYGFMPKTGPLHLLHVVHTVIAIGYCFATIVYHYLNSRERRPQIRSAFITFILFSCSSHGYLAAYGIVFYPIGWFFVSAGLGYSLYKMFFSTFAGLSVRAKHLESEIEKEKEKNRYLVDVFSRDIKHRIDTGMAALRRAQEEPNYHKYVELTIDEQKNMNRMVGTLINLFVIEQIVLKKRRMDVGSIIRDLQNEWKSAFIKRKIQLLVHEALSATVSVDPQYMKLVWDNLFTYAFQNTYADGHVEIKIKNTEDFVTVAFVITGQQIVATVQNSVFVGSPIEYSTGLDNWGLELHYCKMMVEKHNGRFEYSTSENSKNEIVVALPV